ncbi:methionyl-tRNA formyltransferase [Clostridia bacterium]|nr:methionyl-tRNA formyltransferase [Clostridia bacterium]
MKIVFFGTPEYSVPSLRELFNTHEVLCVITQPDKPKGRGEKIEASPVKIFAETHNIPVLQPERARNKTFIEQLRAFNADAFIVTAYGQILPQAVLTMPKFGALNAHGSLLPKFRGASPIQHAILNGESVTGVTVMQMGAGVDTGDMLLKKEIAIEPDDNAGTLHAKMAELSAIALIEVLPLVERDSVFPVSQDGAEFTYAPLIKKEDALIDWSKPAEQIVNLVRAMNPWPCAYAAWNGAVLKVWEAKVSDIASENRKAGEVLSANKGGITVACGNGAVTLTEVQASNSKRMSAAAFANGRKIESFI